MPQADASNSTRTPVSQPQTNCLVERLAIEIADLWDAFNFAEAARSGDAESIELHRMDLEEVAANIPARSLAGALFQLRLMHSEVENVEARLHEPIRAPSFLDDEGRRLFEEQANRDSLSARREIANLRRLLASVTTVVKDIVGDEHPASATLARIYESNETTPWTKRIAEMAQRERIRYVQGC